MSTDAHTTSAPVLPPPRSEVGVIGWVRANLFGSRFSGALTIISVAALLVGGWFGLKWVFFDADWGVIAQIGGLFVLGPYNTDQSCPGNNCFWRPQVGLLMASVLLGMLWVVTAGGIGKRLAITVAVVTAAFAFLPYSFERMGMDVRLLLLANIPALALGWALARYTSFFGTTRGLGIFALAAFLLTMLLLRGWEDGGPGLLPDRLFEWIPGPGLLVDLIFLPIPPLEPVVDLKNWGGLMLNILLAVAGITLSLPIGIGLALGRRSDLQVVKGICVVFIEVFRGVPLITLLFMSQVLVPLAFPRDFPLDPLPRAAIIITLFSSAYMAENIRGGLQALHPGQAEAARALGLPGWQTTLLISLPQAIRNVIPAIVGQFIALFKDTSLVYIIGMLDIVEESRAYIQGNPELLANARELFIFIAVVFWVFCYGMSYVSRRYELHLGVGER